MCSECMWVGRRASGWGMWGWDRAGLTIDGWGASRRGCCWHVMQKGHRGGVACGLTLGFWDTGVSGCGDGGLARGWVVSYARNGAKRAPHGPTPLRGLGVGPGRTTLCCVQVRAEVKQGFRKLTLWNPARRAWGYEHGTRDIVAADVTKAWAPARHLLQPPLPQPPLFLCQPAPTVVTAPTPHATHSGLRCSGSTAGVGVAQRDVRAQAAGPPPRRGSNRLLA